MQFRCPEQYKNNGVILIQIGGLAPDLWIKTISAKKFDAFRLLSFGVYVFNDFRWFWFNIKTKQIWVYLRIDTIRSYKNVLKRTRKHKYAGVFQDFGKHD